MPFPGYKINEEILPQFVIILQGEDPQLKQRVKDLPPEKIINTHFTDVHMDRRLKIYRDSNLAGSDQDIISFFTKAITST